MARRPRWPCSPSQRAGWLGTTEAGARAAQQEQSVNLVSVPGAWRAGVAVFRGITVKPFLRLAPLNVLTLEFVLCRARLLHALLGLSQQITFLWADSIPGPRGGCSHSSGCTHLGAKSSTTRGTSMFPRRL